MANPEQEQRTGIWIEDGLIHRRDSLQEPFSRTYLPQKPEDIPEVIRILELLHDGANMTEWTPEVEDNQERLVEELTKLIK